MRKVEFHTGKNRKYVMIDMDDMAEFKLAFTKPIVSWAGMALTEGGIDAFLLSMRMLGVKDIPDDIPTKGLDSSTIYFKCCDRIAATELPALTLLKSVLQEAEEIAMANVEPIIVPEITITNAVVESVPLNVIEPVEEIAVLEVVEAITVTEVVATISETNEMSTVEAINQNQEVLIMKTTVETKAVEAAATNMAKLEAGAKFLISNIETLKNKVLVSAKAVEKMTPSQIEAYLGEKSQTIFEDIVNSAAAYSANLKKDIESFPSFGAKAKKVDGIITTISEILDEEGVNGWGKVKQIVVALVKWIVRLFIRVAQILLRLTVTVVVGAIKVGAVAIGSTAKFLSVLDVEIVKPVSKGGKNMFAKYKEVAAQKKAIKKAEAEAADDFEDYVEGMNI